MTVTYSADPDIQWLVKLGHFVLHEPFDVAWQREGRAEVAFAVPAGFTTDLASIPRWALSIVGGKIGRHLQPSITHDYCYEDGVPGMTRAEADSLFLDGMKAAGVGWLRRNVMYAAVRAAGGVLWG